MNRMLRKLRSKQFSMRALLAAVTAVATVFGWFAVKADQRRREDIIVQSVRESCDCDVTFELMYDQRPRWDLGVSSTDGARWYDWLDWFVRESIYDRTVLGIRGKLDDSGLKRISEFPRLRVLIIDRWSAITDDGLAPLSTLTRLESLCLGTARDTETDLRCLARMRELTTLALWHFRPSGAGWEAIRSLPRLKSLEIDSVQVGTDVMSQLPTLTRLRELSIGQLVDDEELAWLDRLPPQLKVLVIDGQVTDEEIPLLSHLTGLECLVVGGTHITARGVGELQRALPNCSIEGPAPAAEP